MKLPCSPFKRQVDVMCGSEQGHAPDPKSLAAFGPGDACRSATKNTCHQF